MNKQAILQLNKVNKLFYQQIGSDFDDTRKQPWHGWDHIIPHIQKKIIEKKQVHILDIGCGNGRFLKFIVSKWKNSNIFYHGIDNNQFLLNKAKNVVPTVINTSSKKPSIKTQFTHQDIVTSLLHSKKSFLEEKSYDVIVAFGVFHHIPGFRTRHQLMKYLADSAKETAIICVSFWQFNKSKRLLKKQASPILVNIKAEDLEKNDYILDWNRATFGYRYCHLSDKDEIKKIIKNTQTTILFEFDDDGKTKNLNHYLVLEKATQ